MLLCLKEDANLLMVENFTAKLGIAAETKLVDVPRNPPVDKA
jgi:hypothetical protein